MPVWGYVGALVGEQIGGAIQNVWASGAVTGGGWRIGGLVGRNDGGVIFDSWTRSDVRGDRRVGGLVGAVDIRNIGGVRTVPVIERGQAMGNVRGDGDVGGLVGRNGGGMISEKPIVRNGDRRREYRRLDRLPPSAGDIGFNGSTGPVRGNINVGGLVRASCESGRRRKLVDRGGDGQRECRRLDRQHHLRWRGYL